MTETVDCVWDCDLRCVRCGYQARRENTHRHCPAGNGPDQFTRLAHYSSAVRKWLLAGMPRRTSHDVSRLLSICRACPLYDAAQHICTHKDCGCRAGSATKALTNKLAMGTERCPEGRWEAMRPPTDRRLRLGMILPGLHGGGVESWAVSLCRELRANPSLGVDPVCVASVGGTSANRVIVSELAQSTTVVSAARADAGMVYGVKDAATACRMCADASEVIVIWGIVGLPALLSDHRRADLSIVGMSHGAAAWWYSVDEWLRREWVATCSHWVGVSRCATECLPAGAVSLANGIDLCRLEVTRSRREIRHEAGLPDDARVIVYHARLSKEKHMERAIQAMAHTERDVWLWIVGDGSDAYRDNLERLARDSRVVISPYRRDVGNVLAASDAGLLLSEAEGYCLSAVETLAAGLPLASTAVGVLPEISAALGRPCHVPISAGAADHEIGRAIMRALGPEHRQHVGAIQRYVRQEHSASAMARRWSVALRALCASPLPVRP